MSFIVKLSADSQKLNWVLLGCSLLLTLIMAVVLGALSGASRESPQRKASTYFTDDDGMRAAYLAMRQFTPAGRWRSVLMALPPPSAAVPAAQDSAAPSDAGQAGDAAQWDRVDTLILANPTQSLSPAEAGALLQWLEDGGQAILCLAVDWPISAHQSAFRPQKEEEEPASSHRSERDGFLRRLGVSIRASDEESSESSDQAAGQETRGGTEGAPRTDLDLEPVARLTGEGLQIIAGRPGQPTAVWKSVGEGRVGIITDPWAFSNRRLQRTSNEVWLIQTAAVWGAGRTVFDEFHHGFVRQRRLVSLLASFAATPWGWMCLQMLLALMVYLLIFRSRFGRLKKPPAPHRSSPLQWIEARAGLLQAAGAGRLCAQWMHRSLALKLSRSLGYSVDIDEERAQRKLSGGDHPRARRFQEYLRLWRKLPRQGALSTQQLTSLARAAGLLSQELKARK